MEEPSDSDSGSASSLSESIGSADEEFEVDLETLPTTELKDLLHRIVTANVKLENENKLMEDAIKEVEQFKWPDMSGEKDGSHNKTSSVQYASADSGNFVPEVAETDSNIYPPDRRKSRFRSALVEMQPVLRVQYKCYIASKKFSVLQSILENLQKSKDLKIDDLKAELEEISMKTAAVEDEKYLFNDSVRIKGKHPVTKKVMAEKVRTYFEHSLKKKLILTERLRLRASFNRMLKKKVIAEMEEKKELSENLDDVDFNKVKIEHKKCSDRLKEYNRRFLQLKALSNRSVQVLTDFKKQLDKEISDVETIVKQIRWQDRLKNIIQYEESSFNQKKIKYETAKQKILNNPKRKHVPVVMDYVHLKAQIKEKEKAVQSWKSKVAVAQQARFLHLSSKRFL